MGYPQQIPHVRYTKSHLSHIEVLRLNHRRGKPRYVRTPYNFDANHTFAYRENKKKVSKQCYKSECYPLYISFLI